MTSPTDFTVCIESGTLLEITRAFDEDEDLDFCSDGQETGERGTRQILRQLPSVVELRATKGRAGTFVRIPSGLTDTSDKGEGLSTSGIDGDGCCSARQFAGAETGRRRRTAMALPCRRFPPRDRRRMRVHSDIRTRGTNTIRVVRFSKEGTAGEAGAGIASDKGDVGNKPGEML